MKRLKILLLILISFAGFANAQQTINTIELNTNWEYTHFPYCQTDEQVQETQHWTFPEQQELKNS